MSMFKSPLSMGVLVAFFYVLITWSLYHRWETSLPPSEMPGLLSILLFPIPWIVAGMTGGTIPFWSVLLQGLFLGGLAYLSVKARLIRKG